MEFQILIYFIFYENYFKMNMNEILYNISDYNVCIYYYWQQ